MSAAETDTSWLLQAACRGCNPEIFFPSRGENRALQKAKLICATCPCRPQCLDYALSSPYLMQGVWGGLSERQRRTLRRTTAAAQRKQEMQT